MDAERISLGIHASFLFSDASLAGGNFKMMDVAPHSHLDAAGKCFEDTFNLVVLVGAFCLDVEVHTGRVTQ